MSKKQSAKLDSLLAVQTLFASSLTLVSSLPALEEAAEELAETVLELNLNVKVQSVPTGAAQAKKEAGIAVGDAAFEVAGGVYSFATKSGARSKSTRLNSSHGGISRMPSSA